MELVDKIIKIKITILIVVGLIILTAFGVIIDNIDEKDTGKDKGKIAKQYNNMIYKGRELTNTI